MAAQWNEEVNEEDEAIRWLLATVIATPEIPFSLTYSGTSQTACIRFCVQHEDENGMVKT